MEIISEKLNKSSWEQERILSIVSWKINSILAHPKNDFCDQINTILERMLNYSIKNLNDDDVSQKNYFDHVCHFMNSLFGNIHIKKFYNTAPKISYHDYNQMNFGSQITHNIYGKDWQLFYRNEVWWWSCHHWTILFYNVLEKIKKGWIDIDFKIALYTETEWHSMIIMNFQWESYCIDIGKYNEDIIRKITTKDDIYNLPALLKAKEINLFNNIQDFVTTLEKKSFKNIRLIFRPKIENNDSKDIEITINNENITVSVEDKDYQVFTNNIILPKKIRDWEVINYIIQNSKWNKIDKEEIMKYINIVRLKININRLKSLFQS